jgi:tetratricopeptide (TPR) repeat protein
LEIDPALARAHANLAQISWQIDFQWQAAEQEFKRVVELNPNSGDAHFKYAEYLEAMGRSDEGEKEWDLVQQLDPGNQMLPDRFLYRRQFDRLIELRRNNVERKAFGPSAHWDLGFAYDLAGMHKEAVDQWTQTMVELEYSDLAAALRQGYASGGFEGAMREWVNGLEKYRNSTNLPIFLPAYVYTRTGDRDRAFEWLERAYALRDTAMLDLKVNPFWDDLRSDPRFDRLVSRVGLP